MSNITNSPNCSTRDMASQTNERRGVRQDNSPLRPPVAELYEDTRSLWISLAMNLSCISLYGYAIYYQNFDPQGAVFIKLREPLLQPYGLWKYLTYNCLILQVLSAFMHILATFRPKYRIVRDFLFTTLAYPIGSVVVYSFWAVWWTQGREMIYPTSVELYYPSWLNHVTHTICVPVNMAQTYLTFHRYFRKGSIVSVFYIVIYWMYLVYIRVQTGIFVYPFLNYMGVMSIIIYFLTNIFSTLALYESGYFMTAIFHRRKIKIHQRTD